MIQGDPERFYLDGGYEKLNPSWDTDDSVWKAGLVAEMLSRHHLIPSTLVEVGCGAGGVLAALQAKLKSTRLHGWDIAPGAARFWHQHADIEFNQGDFLARTARTFDVVLLLDVIEHISNPHDFLMRLRPHGRHHLLHIPLDLSVASVLREAPLLNQRRTVGHIHYFTRNLALELLSECGYEIIDCRFSGAHLRPQKTLWAKLYSMMRRLVFAANRELGVRLLGGDTLLLLVRPKLQNNNV